MKKCHHCHSTPLPGRLEALASEHDPSTSPALLAPSGRLCLINLADGARSWRCLFGESPRAPAVLLAGSERLQCTSPGHHAAPGSLLQRLQRRWRSFWRHSRNKRRWHGPRTPRAPPTLASRAQYLMPISFCISSHSRPTSASIVLVQIACRGTPPCH